MTTANHARDLLTQWRISQEALSRLEADLAVELQACLEGRSETPRALIIEVETARAKTALLFQRTVDALDAQSPLSTGHTDFGTLR